MDAGTVSSLAGVPGARAGVPGKRIVLATFGSYGDLHPYMALALGLKERGHRVTIATCGMYREKVEGEGIGFRPIRPEMLPPEEAREMMARVMDPRLGAATVIRDLMMPHVREQYEDLWAATEGADLLTSHVITYAAPLVGERRGMPWIGTVLQPMVFASAYDPPVSPQFPWLSPSYRLGPGFCGAVLRAGKAALRRWAEPVAQLRAELGLPPGEHPIFEGQFSPYLNLALFSPLFGNPQPDWPPHTQVTGFPFYDRMAAGQGMPEELERFLAEGEAPIVFTLGSSAVMVAEDFYTASAAAARLLGRRAVLLAGQEGWNRLPDPLPPGVIACPYAPHSELFPRAAAIVHQGGVGTTAQALRSGRPMLVVPFAHDQPDNAGRVSRLGAGRTLARRRYTPTAAARELRVLLEDPAFAARAGEVGRQVRSEDGVGTACDAIDSLLLSAAKRG